MDEIKERLNATSEKTVEAYVKWIESDKDGKVMVELQDAIHELRKVASRVEIEMAVSERKELAQRPMDIPPHRSQKNRNRNNNHQRNQDNKKLSEDKKKEISAPTPAISLESTSSGVEVETKKVRKRIIRRPKPE